MFHLVDGLVPGVLGELGEPPVALHFGVQEVLVDRGQFAGELLVEQGNNLIIAAHEGSNPLWVGSG